MARKNEPGYVYVFSNKSLPYLKIGHTKMPPRCRAQRLTIIEKTPKPFEVEWSGWVDSCREVESFLHKHFADFKVKREFFNINKEDAIRLLKEKFSPKDELEVVKNLLEGRRSSQL